MLPLKQVQESLMEVVLIRSGLCMLAAGDECNSGTAANSSCALWVLNIPPLFFKGQNVLSQPSAVDSWTCCLSSVVTL